MLQLRLAGLLALLMGLLYATSAQAQGRCKAPQGRAPGTVAQCGTAPRQFRPQPYTVNNYLVPQRTPRGSYYAPFGPNQSQWQQFDARTGEYGPVEPNPYGKNGRLSPSRTTRHLYETRVKPRVNRLRD